MPFSHHSHSGQFCPDHARNTLEEMVQAAIAKSMEMVALTEHMPRNDQDRYPEEIEMGWSLAISQTNHANFYREATRLRSKYGTQIQILIGFESEWIRPSSQDLIAESLQAFAFDLFVGSVHHVHTKPIDYDQTGYDAAKAVAGGSDRQLFNDYFDAQFSMLQAVNPPVIGHFDLIRLRSEDPSRELRRWPDVWQRIMRNLLLIVAYGTLLEINFASLRKGLSEPYPKGEIIEAFGQLGGKVCLSDDSHGVDQVGQNYDQCISYLESHQISHIHFLTTSREGAEESWDARFPLVRVQQLEIHDLAQRPFWNVFPSDVPNDVFHRAARVTTYGQHWKLALAVTSEN